jgi:hypothetical protein
MPTNSATLADDHASGLAPDDERRPDEFWNDFSDD